MNKRNMIVNISGGQVNIAKDNATINAIQNNGLDGNEFETIIQANAKGLVIENVPIRVNKEERPSRLISNIFVYILRSILTMTRMFIVYRPFRFFATISAIFLILGLLTGGRFLYYYFVGEGSGHVQSLILASILIITGVQTFVVAIASDLLSINRKLLEDIQMRLKNK